MSGVRCPWAGNHEHVSGKQESEHHGQDTRHQHEKPRHHEQDHDPVGIDVRFTHCNDLVFIEHPAPVHPDIPDQTDGWKSTRDHK